MKLILLIVIFPFFIFGQKTISGKIIDSKTKESIPFVTVGLLNENIGTSANEDGNFQIFTKSHIGIDTLIFTCLGYKTLKIGININRELNYKIELDEHVLVLKELNVLKNKSEEIINLNDFSECENVFVSNNGYLAQLAQHFKADKENSLLSSIKICRSHMPILDPERTIFRIRIYSMSLQTNAPALDLCNQIIEVKSSKETIVVNLEKYNIIIPNKDFFVAIEWLKIPYNMQKIKNKLKGDYYLYKPSVGWSNNISPNVETWALNNKNEWFRLKTSTKKTNLAMAATLKY